MTTNELKEGALEAMLLPMQKEWVELEILSLKRGTKKRESVLEMLNWRGTCTPFSVRSTLVER